MKILTGNDLRNGRVVWWDGQGWSIHVEDAADVGDQADAILAHEDAACRVNGGYAIDADRQMWPYRDWVIRALNDDLPFDRFTIEQLAGDLQIAGVKIGMLGGRANAAVVADFLQQHEPPHVVLDPVIKPTSGSA